MLLYPLAIALIALIFTNNIFKGYQSVYVGTIIGVGVVAILDALKDAKVSPDTINRVFGFISLIESGAGWIITGLIGAVIGFSIGKLKADKSVIIDVAGREVVEV